VDRYLGYSTYSSYESYNTYGPNAEKPKLAGAYEVTSFKMFQEGIEDNSIPDDKYWEGLYQSYTTVFLVKTKMGLRGYPCEVDTAEQIINLKSWGDSLFQQIHYEYLDGKDLHLKGNFYEDSLDVVLKYKDRDDFPLIKREFHWIQEYPYNR